MTLRVHDVQSCSAVILGCKPRKTMFSAVYLSTSGTRATCELSRRPSGRERLVGVEEGEVMLTTQ